MVYLVLVRKYFRKPKLTSFFHFYREYQGQIIAPFYASSCEKVEEEELILLGPELCGVYQGDGSAEFSECLTSQTSLTNSFYSVCVYDYCENYLTSIPTENTTSSCEDSRCYLFVNTDYNSYVLLVYFVDFLMLRYMGAVMENLNKPVF